MTPHNTHRDIEAPSLLRRPRPMPSQRAARWLGGFLARAGHRLPPSTRAMGRPVILGILAALVVGFVADIGPWSRLAGALLGTADAQEAAAPPPVGDGAVPSEADRAALRYFAREGDVDRLEAELRRLRALYPSWNPPPDLLDAQGEDLELQRVYDLVGAQRFDEAREAIAARQQRDPTYEPPQRLVALIELGETRQSLREASDAGNSLEVLRIAEANEGILTCDDVDSLWRVAEAFAATGRPNRAYDAYAYVINTCEDQGARGSSLQKAADNLEPAFVIELFDLSDAQLGSGAFGEAQLGIIRAAVSEAGAQESFAVPEAYLNLLAEFARTGENLEDAMLVGFYLYRTGFPSEAAQWFRFALDNGLGADAAEGYITALRATGGREDDFLAREVAYEWREQTPELMEAYLGAVATLLASDEFGQRSIDDVDQITVERYVPIVVQQRDPNGAQALGWYAFNTCQFIIAEEWFITSANWVPTEAALFGLALTRLRLGDQEGFDDVVDEWGPLYESVSALGQGEVLDPADPLTGAVDDPTDEVGVESVICDPQERERLQELIAEEEALNLTEAGSLTAGISVRQLARRPAGSERPSIPRRSVVIRPDQPRRPRSLLAQVQTQGVQTAPTPTPTSPTVTPPGAPLALPSPPQPGGGRIIAPAPVISAQEGRESIIRQRALRDEPRFEDTRSRTFQRRRNLRVRDGRGASASTRRRSPATITNRTSARDGSTVQRRVRQGASSDLDREVAAIVSRPRSSSRRRLSRRSSGGGGSAGGTAAQQALAARNFSRCVALTDRAIASGRLSSTDAAARGFCLLELERPIEAAQAFQLASVASRRGTSTRQDAVYGSTLAAIARNATNVAAVEATKAPLSRARRTELQIAILTQRAVAANRDGRYTEALYFLDQRSRIAPLQKDLMLLRGYAYLNAGDYRSARRVFRALDRAGGTGETAAAINVVNERLLPPSFRSQIGDGFSAN